MASEPGDMCKPGGKAGIILPVTESEREHSLPLRGVIYCATLIYCFIGVSIIADIFVGSIEAVTSSWKVVRKRSGRQVTTKVWNSTVANLSLMALGSSAPEIALSVIEIVKNGFMAGDLGPSTIVGSAAFNLLVIIGVCIIAIPSGEVRVIHQLPAFYITAVFSLGAYIWLSFILVFNTVDVVDLEEAAATFGFLPILIWVSYVVDVGGLKYVPSLQCLCARFLGEPEENLEASPDALRFSVEKIVMPRPTETERISITVERKKCVDMVSCRYHTEAFRATPGYDFEEVEGALTFDAGVSTCSFEIDIYPKSASKVGRAFLVVLEDDRGTEGAAVEFDPARDGGAEQALLTVVIEGAAADAKYNPLVRCIDHCINIDTLRRGNADWIDQWISFLYVNGSPEEQQEASKAAWVWHILTSPWRLAFCLTPPCAYFGGWPCFFTSLAFIGGVTALISDLAEMFGCVCSVPDVMTAITFVALGTSMPDLFASLAAAKADTTADASIVNVTGSNSVNVFVGLGMPWIMAAIYWKFQDRDSDEGRRWAAKYFKEAAENPDKVFFVVRSRNLGFSVLCFTGCCLSVVLLLMLRRRICGGELGGPSLPKYLTFGCFCFLWMSYIFLVSWRVLRYESMDWTEQLSVGNAVMGVDILVICIPLSSIFCEWAAQKRRNIRISRKAASEEFDQANKGDTEPSPVASNGTNGANGTKASPRSNEQPPSPPSVAGVSTKSVSMDFPEEHHSQPVAIPSTIYMVSHPQDGIPFPAFAADSVQKSCCC